MDTLETTRIVNRHTAKLLDKLEEGNCPSVYVDAVKSQLRWMRSDLQRSMNPQEQHEEIETHG